MGNTKKFNSNDVLQKAMELFWEKGYLATTTRDLQKATNLKPGSLYCSFKNKENLFAKSLNFYLENLRREFDLYLERFDNPLLSLKHFVIDTVIESSNPSHLCFVSKSHIELKNTELEKLPESLIREVENWLLNVFIEAERKKFLSKDKEAKETSKKFLIRYFGWRTYLLTSEDKDYLRKDIDQFFSSISIDSNNS